MKHAVVIAASVLLIALPLFGVAADAGAGKVELRLHYRAGQTYRCTMQVEDSTVRWVDGTEMESAETVEGTYTFSVKALDDEGVATLQMIVDRIVYDKKGEGGEFHLDTDEPEAEAADLEVRILKLMAGRAFTLKVKPNGEIVELTGAEAILEDVKKLLPEDENVRKMILGNIERAFGNEAVRVKMDPFPGLYPDEAVAVGDSWDQFTLDSRKDGVATVAFEKTIEPDPDAEPEQTGDGTVRSNLAGTRKGTVRIDEETGLIIEGRLDLELKGEYLFTSTQDPENEISVPTTVVQSTTLKMQEVDPAADQ